MHPHLIWLVNQKSCPNCGSEEIKGNVDSQLEKVSLECCHCNWKLSNVNYSDVSKLITVIAFPKHVKGKNV